MMLGLFIIVLLAGGVLAWWGERWGASVSRWTALIALSFDFCLILSMVFLQEASSLDGPWMAEWKLPWISRFGIHLHLALDGLSLLLLLLTVFLGISAVVASWTEIQHKVGFFHFNILWVLAGVVGVFLAVDLFVFFVWWEVMLVPMYLLINVWGHEQRAYAAMKFFLFTQGGSLLMLVAIVALVIIHYQQTDSLTFGLTELLETSLTPTQEMWLLLSFGVAFAVKLPAVPIHTWLADAHTEAPTGGSVILAGLLLKTGAYGFLRFGLPLFPQAAESIAPIAMTLGVISILYGSLMAFAQTDLKRLVAYTSIGHIGFVLLGIFAMNAYAIQGAVMQMIAHGISAAALFILVGALQERVQTRDIRRMGGLWNVVPKFGGIALFFAMASLGLPGLANFIGEFLVLVGTFRVNIILTVFAALGIIGAAIYSLFFIHGTFHGPNTEGWTIPDLAPRHLALLGVMMALQVGMGLFPQPVFQTADPFITGLHASLSSPLHVLTLEQ
jgi:NADH-quinone oxidoreductase subunit M